MSVRGHSASQSSALNLGGSKKVKHGLNLIDTRILEVCKSQNVSQTSALAHGGCKEVKFRRNSIGTRILEVWERSEYVADQCFWLRRVARRSEKACGIAVIDENDRWVLVITCSDQ